MAFSKDDYSKFQADDFDVKEWVNSAFRNQQEPGVNKDQYATTLVMKLQMFIQEVNSVIEETSQQALQNLPRVMREIDAVQQEAILLQNQMQMVKHDIQKVEQDTSQSMQILLKLDGIKSRMKSASDALKEVDNWSTLSADIEDVFQSQDVKAITERLVGMQQCLLMLSDTPDYGDRCQHLEQLKNRLEALLSPQLVAAFSSRSIDAAQMYSHVFEDINRLPQLYKYYHKCQKGQLLKSWRDVIDTNPDSSMQEWLTEFYDLLLATWHSQVKWCNQVFHDPIPIVCDLLTETMTSLDPSIASCMTKLIDQQGNTLHTLTDLKQISERFAKSLEGAVEGHVTDKFEQVASTERLFMTIYSPYRPYLIKYKALEESLLSSELNSIRLDHEEILDSVRLLGESVGKVFSVANQASDRCVKLSNGYCYLQLLDALRTYFLSYCREFNRVVINIKEKCRTISGAGDAEDWSMFQHSLRIIQTCGELIMHAGELDESLINSIMQSIGRHIGLSSPMKEQEKWPGTKSQLQKNAVLFLSNQGDINSLQEFLVKLEEGETTSVLGQLLDEIGSLSEAVHKLAFHIVFAQLKGHLNNLANMEVWTSRSSGGAIVANLPTFSMSPLEYITKIGQYLMTLPQQLEPFTMQDNPAVVIALKYGRLPYTEDQELPEHTADLWLQSVARATMHSYTEEILKIHELSPHSTKQLITDIDYLCNVLEDLGLSPSENLVNISRLLKASPDEYADIAERMPQRVAHAISSMRNIDIY